MKRRYELVAYSFDAGEDEASAAGIAEIEFGPVETGVIWKIERLAFTTNSATGPETFIYVPSFAPANIADHSTGFHGARSYDPELIVLGGQSLFVRATSLTAASLYRARIQYRIEEQVFEIPDLGIGPLVEACRDLVDELRRSRV